jgi:uncharacterized protein YndB with AHSA1/START domain
VTATTRLGKVLRDGDGVRLEFVRTYDAPLEDVWSAITDPERLARWFGRWSGDPATGTVQIVMSAEGDAVPESVTIDECEPPRRLAVTRRSPEGPWPLVVTLSEQGTGTSLHFIHHLGEAADDASSIGPGWQFYLDRLGAVIADLPLPDSWEDYYPSLANFYSVPTEPAPT